MNFPEYLKGYLAASQMIEHTELTERETLKELRKATCKMQQNRNSYNTGYYDRIKHLYAGMGA